jgi:hypothetical protein
MKHCFHFAIETIDSNAVERGIVEIRRWRKIANPLRAG